MNAVREIAGYGVAWQYFLLFCDDGTRIAGTIAKNGRLSELWLSVYGAESAAFDLYYPAGALNLSPRGWSLRSNFLIRDGKRVWVRVAERELELEAAGLSTVDWPDNRISHGTDGSRVDWTVSVLRADFQGSLTLGGRKRAISGLMFQDEVSHDLKIGSPVFLRNFRSWTWGMLYGDDLSLLFVDVRHRTAPFRFICVAGPDGIVSSNSGIGPHGFNAVYGGKYPHGTIRLEYGERPIELALDRRQPVLHGRGAERLFMKIFKPKYHSFGTWRWGDKTGVAYVESLRLR